MPEVSLITSAVLGPQTTSATWAWDEAREGVPEPLPIPAGSTPPLWLDQVPCSVRRP